MRDDLKTKIRPIAIHLPQFHPFPQNDGWWGKGFTEWTNVTKAKPLFHGHIQPQLPSDLGFYDLRLEEARLAQESLAKEHGFFGFCYYHYWFNGTLLMETPLELKLKNPQEDFPFMLCWANENWTKVWDGSENNILIKQNYSKEDHIAHINYLIPFFKDDRYITIDGKVVFAVYRSSNIPDFDNVAEMWKLEAKKNGIELYITVFESFGESGAESGCKNVDAWIEFQPHSGIKTISEIERNKILLEKQNFKTLRDEVNLTTIQQSFNHWRNKLFSGNQSPSDNIKNGKTLEYSDFVAADLYAHVNDKKIYKQFKCVCPGFDNSPRKSNNYFVLKNQSPEIFQYWIEEKLKTFKPYSKEENLFFVNAWNEWAEGNFLEPSQYWGNSFLLAAKKAFAKL